ncbi:MAG: extracellular solute-binding protein [Treponema sp.]|jgi:ABC-type glycerol-3-phosphate transport system substrate-binding protein|nr:extracellular solute-binding protein [Treponema sp.]
MYRKINEKSRGWDAKRIDIFLFLAATVLCLTFIGTNLFIKDAAAQRAELILSRQCKDLFGADLVGALIKEFEERHPELRLRLESADADDSGDQPATPDIVFFDEDRFKVPQAALIPLNPYLVVETGDETGESPVEAAAGAGVETAAEQRAILLVSFMDLLFYNIEILAAAGFDRPPKTRDEFLACAKAVSGLRAASGEAGGGFTGSGVYGAALGLSEDDPLALRRDVFSWIWAAGGDLNPPDRDGRPYFTGRTVTDVIAFLEQLNREGTFAPGTFVRTGADRIEDFAGGKIAMMIASSREIPFLRKRMNSSAFGVTIIPGPSVAAKNHIALSGVYAGISAGCPRPDEAWTFLAFLAEKSPALAAGLEAVPGSLPEFPGAFSGDYIKDDPLYSKALDIFEASEIVQGFSGQSVEELEHAVREELRLFFERDQSPADTAAAIQRRWDSL